MRVYMLFHYRPEQVLLGFQEVEAPRISIQSAHEGGKVVTLGTGPLYPTPRINAGVTSIYGNKKLWFIKKG
jgi:hypothetical protein